ncbi:MAG: succinate--CoA ligase subunit beta, partial [Planctomycetes bacterium]|nr:succinate--CoA ligase subunit beta [Planctomycetota bacterium]
MKVHEYQARQLLEDAGVPVPKAMVVETSQDARRAYDRLTGREGADCAVLKAQVHAGGRGKGGGVRVVCSAEDAYEHAHQILSSPLITPQTGPEGVKVRRLMVAAAVTIDREFYLSIVMDRARACPLLIASAEGGVEIEEVAA